MAMPEHLAHLLAVKKVKGSILSTNRVLAKDVKSCTYCVSRGNTLSIESVVCYVVWLGSIKCIGLKTCAKCTGLNTCCIQDGYRTEVPQHSIEIS